MHIDCLVEPAAATGLFPHSMLFKEWVADSLVPLLVLSSVEPSRSSSSRSAHICCSIRVGKARWWHHLRTEAVEERSAMLRVLAALYHHLLYQMLL